MDREFHYSMTYLIARRAGLGRDDSVTVACTCQAVDENQRVKKINEGTTWFYESYVSQTLKLLKPNSQRLRIYPVFHFIPGEPNAPSAARADGQTHPLNTTPDSPLANQCFDEAADTGDLYQLGIACHAYADTWAHQNFIGCKDDFNGMPGSLNKWIPNIGHADAKHQPDIPGLVWTDGRLQASSVNNTERFAAAAGRVFDKLVAFVGDGSRQAHRSALVSDLSEAMSQPGRHRRRGACSCRNCSYRRLAESSEYGGEDIPDFRLSDWFGEAIATRTVPGEDRDEEYRWRRPSERQGTRWHQFQEAVKAYQRRVLALYNASVFPSLDGDLVERIMRFR